MVDILTHGSITMTTEYVRELLDSPNNEYLLDSSISKVVERVYQYVKDNTDISGSNYQSVVDAVYAVAVWQLYMIYVESISEHFKLQEPTQIKERLRDFKELAIIYLKNIGIVWPLDRFGVPIVEDVTTTNIIYGFAGVAGTLTLNEIYENG